jgi:YkoY family integral membrane protein
MYFTTQDFFIIGFLAFLEGILSIDNALVLAILARNLPKEQQKKALTYGLWGAVLFRLIALSLVTQLIAWTWVKFVGGGYLIFIAVKYFFQKAKEDENHHAKKIHHSFWKTVIVIELTDIAFAVDSILAAVALSNKFWVIFIGGIIGVVLMRFAAGGFMKILTKFPKFETTAYLLVLTIGIKIIIEALKLDGLDFHSASNPAFWGFWSIMMLCLIYGFKDRR